MSEGFSIWRVYEVTDPQGNTYQIAQLVDKGGNFGQLVRKKDADWVPEEQLSLADLIMPEQRLSEWSVRQIEDGPAPVKDVGVSTTPVAFSRAVKADRLQYLRGIKHVKLIEDRGKWNAAYVANTDTIELERKWETLPLDEKVEILLHEAGHRGQHLEPEVYAAFLASKRDTLENFLSMANCVHLKDYAENGIDETAKAQESFAESYSRFCLGREMPDEIRNFWAKRVAPGT